MRRRFHDLADFPALERLSRQWEIIRDEVWQLDAPVLDIDRVDKSHEEVYAEILERGQGSGWLKGWSGDKQPNPQWLSYGLVLFDQTAFDVPQRMPRTIALLREIHGIKVCALNKLYGNTLLSTHVHEELRREGLLQYHLCLQAPEVDNLNYLNVAGEFVQQVPGAAYVFDGSLPHFAVNATDWERIILYMEFHVESLRRQ